MTAAQHMYVVRTSNGAILGGYARSDDAERCKAVWERRFALNGITGVEVFIREQGE